MDILAIRPITFLNIILFRTIDKSPRLKKSPFPKSSKLKVSANCKHTMSRWFNIAGPCRDDKHYMLPATSRLPDLSMLIEQESYFVVHAPRQTGKTTAMLG